MIDWVKGDLLESDCDYICHQVNCQGRMGSGIAKSIKEKWPIVYTEYMKKCQDRENEVYLMCSGLENDIDWSQTLLGEIQKIEINPHDAKYVINMFAQENYGYDGKRYTSYDAFWMCLEQIKNSVPRGRKIGFPEGIGCGLGGANWQVIETMIYEVLDNDYKVYIYKLEK